MPLADRNGARPRDSDRGSARRAQTHSATPAVGWEPAFRHWADAELALLPGSGGAPLLDQAMPRFERIMIEAALARTGGRKRDASELLGWGRNTLTRKIKDLGMHADDHDDEED